jgi:hypothetical protein
MDASRNHPACGRKKDEGRRRKQRLALAAFFFFLLPSSFFLSAALTASRHTDPLPSELQAPVAAQLRPSGVRAAVNGATLSFWWSAGVPLSGAGGVGWSAVPEGALIGAVRISQDFRDIRGRIMKPGIYTLRYGIQPDNGDHLGVSPHRQFLLVSPAADDKDPAPLGHEGTVELSKGAVGGSHPAVWSIDPPAATQPVLSIHKTDLDHQAIVVEVPAARDGKPAGALKFGIVLVGKIEA